MLSKTRIIVLHRYAYSDSSWVVKGISAEHGIVSLLIKGGKRKESPFRGVLDPLAESDVVLHPSRTDLHIVREAVLYQWFPEVRKDLTAEAEALAMAEVLLRFSPQGTPLSQEFSLLENYLTLLNSENRGNSYVSEFLLELSHLWGFDFNIHSCGGCSLDFQNPPVDFEVESGNVFCDKCSSRRPIGRRKEYLEDLFRLSKKMPPLNPSLTETGIMHYLQQHLGLTHKDIHSITWLHEVRKLCSQQKKSS